MAVNVEIWKPEIIASLFKSNEWLMRATNADEYVVGGSVVHIPQPGAPPNVVRNRTTVPATAVKRADTDIVYVLDEYTSDPRLITDIDKKELSYDKRQSIITDDIGQLKETAADNMLYRWTVNIPAGNKIPTTGTAGAATAPGATGTRKLITEADIRSAQTLLNKQNIPKEGRVLILTSDMLNHLMSDNSLKYAFQQVVNLKEGALGRLYGFDIYERSSVIRETAGGVVKLPEAANAIDDSECAVFYHENTVERAMGTVSIFDNPNRAEFYGDLISFLVRMGGRNRRGDNRGIGYIAARP
jgi:hypothetical protein